MILDFKNLKIIGNNSYNLNRHNIRSQINKFGYSLLKDEGKKYPSGFEVMDKYNELIKHNFFNVEVYKYKDFDFIKVLSMNDEHN
jgi:hypothetical protein